MNILFSETPKPKALPKELEKEVQKTDNKAEDGKSFYTYVSAGKRDPFMSPSQKIGEKPKSIETGETLEGFRQFNISTLKLNGILSTQNGNIAMVKAPDGKMYILKKKSEVGEKGIVKDIYRDRVIIEVKYKAEEKDYSGKPKTKIVYSEVILSLQK